MTNKVIPPLIGMISLISLFTSTAIFADCPRIISQSPYITHQLDYLGLKPCMVGASRYDKSLGLVDTGGLFDPDSEAIAKLKADLWITSDWTKLTDFEAIQPNVKTALRLHSFDSMQQVEDNLMDIARHSDDADALQLAQAFPSAWRSQATQIRTINTKHTSPPKALLISSCGGQPYAFGKSSWLADLFTEAGFEVVGKQKRITHLPETKIANQLEILIQQTQPNLVFIFERQLAPACRLMKLPQGTQIVTLDGTNFLQPAPLLLKGLQQLKDNPLWQ
ncbi:hypothetical protein THMIRHAM_09820 [Thiomicrorhabdus immobilis]|uniref:Fe/B12 periplasmic-binding domain-containing protein n=1 Tax=Thiomicrorhabdus immobilis TaxID=2791037 RepID=A0ABN6CZ59_9GAMM|nr:hypothetical protein [Thiomicrorhabdus immobilis]BCN93197.1 hypothetical protein THMIRHAM_09820 [Thiomicrorhabdus immobilis]